MSIKDITDYVRQTPGNTNPSVIRSMVEREVENGQKDVVKYTPQSLTEEQQAQARTNIGADRFTETTQEVVLLETTVDFTTQGEESFLKTQSNIATGDSMTVVWDGVEYNRTAITYREIPVVVGNIRLGDDTEPDTGEPFLILGSDKLFWVLSADQAIHTVKIYVQIKGIAPTAQLPEVVDFDALGLTPIVLELFNAGGGEKAIMYGQDKLDVIPWLRDPFVRITIPGMGIMCVNPVCILFDEDGCRMMHIDCYIEQSGTLLKFYVRVIRESNALVIKVGFYT